MREINLNIQKLFIQNLRFYRNKIGLTQEQCAEMLGVSTSYYNLVENGKHFPSVDLMNQICTIFKIYPYQLFLFEPFTNDDMQIKEQTEKNCLLIELKDLLNKYL
ncbi:MAG: helix-turn-helix transcriptional regulator [Clostridia bacterium]|nr:helix-turn-helix transcriptional regulator [Clostridia bacterium]